VPNYDNMFAGSNVDADDFDDWLVIQRDLQVDGGLRPVTEEEVIEVRSKAAKVMQALFKELALTPVTNAEVEAATYAHGSNDMPFRDVVADLKAAGDIMTRGITGVDVVAALAKVGYRDVASNVLNMLKQRVSGDYLHTSSILTGDFGIVSAVNNVNDYAGPGTGYRMSNARWEEVKNIPRALDANTMV
jgi:propanediol dehydratase large subunit